METRQGLLAENVDGQLQPEVGVIRPVSSLAELEYGGREALNSLPLKKEKPSQQTLTPFSKSAADKATKIIPEQGFS